MGEVARRAVAISDGRGRELERAETLARAVAALSDEYDSQVASATDNWRLERVGIIERIILWIGLYELESTDCPGPVIIDEALRLAHWFGGEKTPKFVNGVLDKMARERNRL